MTPHKTRLEILSEELLQEDALKQQELEQCYTHLAREAEKPEAERDQGFLTAMKTEVGSLQTAALNLRKSSQSVAAMADELEVRLKEGNPKRTRPLQPPPNSVIDLQEEETNHFAQGINRYKLFLVFFIGSFAGVIVELIWCFAKNGYIESRSALMYGPFNPLYGIGALVLTLALFRYRNRSSAISFIGGMIVGSAVEYACSWAQEMAFGSRSWDYSAMPFNLNGRICLLYSIFWGFLGVLWIKNIYPRMAKLILKMPNNDLGKAIAWATVIFLAINSVITLFAVNRWAERIHNEPATSVADTFLDRQFPDERMEQVFANMEF